MMNLSASGSYRAGGPGSFSSSSLSPLAPPFKVDKTILKLNSANQSVNYPDAPAYSPYFDSTGQFWNPSSSAASGQSLVDESMGVNTSFSLRPGIYGYLGSQSSTTITGAYHVNTGAAHPYESFSYDPFPNRVSSTAEEGEKPYYTPYVPSAPQKDGYLSLGFNSGHGLEWLPNSSSAHLSGCGSSPVDQPQARDGDCRVSFWSGANENEEDKWSGYAQGLSSKSSNFHDSSGYKIPFPFDGTNKSQFSDDANTHPFTDGSCTLPFPSNGVNRSALKQDGCFDIFGGNNFLGNFSENRQNSTPVLDCSRKPTSVSVPISKDNSQEPTLELAIDVCGPQKAKASSPGGHFSQSGFYVFGCSSTTSTHPATMSKPCADSSSFAFNTRATMKLNPRSSAASDNHIGSAGYDSFCPGEPQMSVKFKQQPSVVIKRPVSSVMPSSSKIDEMADSQFKRKNASDKIPLSPLKIQQFSTAGLNLEVNEAQAVFFGGTDVHTPAEDSPCWRGASKRFSPFEVSEVSSPDAPDCHSLSAQVPEIRSFLVDARHSRDAIFAKGFQLKDHEEKSSATQNPLQFDLNAVDGLQFGSDACLSTKKRCTSDQSKSVLDPGITLDTESSDIIIESGKLKTLMGPAPNLWSQARSASTTSEGSENSLPVVIGNSSGLPLGNENKCGNSAAEDFTTIKHFQSSNITDGKIDVEVLLKTMTKLSEIFRCYSSKKRAGVPEQHTMAVEHIIANLNASLQMMAGETTPSTVSLQGTSSGKELPNVPMVKDAEALAAAVKMAGIAKGLLDSIPLKDDTVADMTEASKKILHVDFQDEEMDQQKLLYKTLWLEAEASLCAMTAKARFLSEKAEMEKAPGNVQGAIRLATVDKAIPGPSEFQKPGEVNLPKYSDTRDPYKDLIPIPLTVDTTCIKFEGPKASRDGVCSLSPHATSPGISGDDLDGSGTTSHAVDVEASVISSTQILKNRVENAEGPSCECEHPSGGYDDTLSVDPPGFDSPGKEIACELNRAEIPVLAGYRIFQGGANHDSLNDEHCRSPGGDNYLHSLSPVYQILEVGTDNSDSFLEGGDSTALDELLQNSELLSSSVGDPEEGKASLMARFRIIQSRINQLNFENKDLTLGQTNSQVMEDDVVDLLKQKNNVLLYKFGPYPDLAEDTETDQLDSCINTGPFLTQHFKSSMLKTEIFESWYVNDDSSDWEHVSKEDLGRLN